MPSIPPSRLQYNLIGEQENREGSAMMGAVAQLDGCWNLDKPSLLPEVKQRPSTLNDESHPVKHCLDKPSFNTTGNNDEKGDDNIIVEANVHTLAEDKVHPSIADAIDAKIDGSINASKSNYVCGHDESDHDDDCDSSETSSFSGSDASRSAIRKESSVKPLKAVQFEEFSTLYVFEDEDGPENDYSFQSHNAYNAWYSRSDLRAFRADAFLTANWMVMNGISGEDPSGYTSRMQKSKRHQNANKMARKSNYEFCSRGVECKTPLGRIAKNKRRMDAMRAVILYQQLQRKNWGEQERDSIRHHQNLDLEGLLKIRQIQKEIDTEALANVYRSFCAESKQIATTLGQKDAIDASELHSSSLAIPSKNSTISRSPSFMVPYRCESSTSSHSCPSLCDDDDEDDEENLIRISFVRNEPENESNEDPAYSLAISISNMDRSSDPSSCNHSLSSTKSNAQEDNTVVEVELIQKKDESIVEDKELPSSTNFPKVTRRNSWPLILSCSSESTATPLQSPSGAAPLTSSLYTFQTFFDMISGRDWW